MLCISSASLQEEEGIAYDHPEYYTQNGLQTECTNEEFLHEIYSRFDTNDHSLEQLEKIQSWIHSHFKLKRNLGNTIGKLTSDDLWKKGAVHCGHEMAQIFSTVIRQLGYPAIMVETTSIAWSKDYLDGVERLPHGHVFTEVYVQGEWILFDPVTGRSLADYDPYDPFIPFPLGEEHQGFFAMEKGIDAWDYGIYSLADCIRMQQEAAPYALKEGPS